MWRRAGQIIGWLALVSTLQACSAVKIVYDRAADLAYWYLDGYVDFTEAQSLQVKDELAKLQAWHRQTQLPSYIEALQKLQQQMPGALDAGQACAVFADVRHKLIAVSEQAEPAVAALARTLGVQQLAQLERKFNLGNADYKDDFLAASPQARHNKRYKQAVRRAEMLYGRLDEKQLELVNQGLKQSSFDAELGYTERLRRQYDALQSLRALAASRLTGLTAVDTREKNRAAVHTLFERSLNSPQELYRDYLEKLTQDSCKLFANLHNSTSATQRSKAVETLNRYEQDLTALTGKDRN